MKVLREVNGYKLNQGQFSAKGLFNISDKNDNVSFWLDSETAQDMLDMTDEEYISDSIALINHSLAIYDEK
jgi:hypothetical protein